MSTRPSSRGAARGRVRARLLARPQRILTSPLVRASATAAIVAAALPGNPSLVPEWRLVERHYGAFTDDLRESARAEHGETAFWEYRRSFDHRPPPVEEGSVAAARVADTFLRLPDAARAASVAIPSRSPTSSTGSNPCGARCRSLSTGARTCWSWATATRCGLSSCSSTASRRPRSRSSTSPRDTRSSTASRGSPHCPTAERNRAAKATQVRLVPVHRGAATSTRTVPRSRWPNWSSAGT
ncbi:histidine phosphatase family protein [Oerskovia sp. M15]